MDVWWTETVQFRKYLSLFRSAGVWDLEELLIAMRSPKDITEKTGITNQSDVRSIWKHIEALRKRHSLYGDATGQTKENREKETVSMADVSSNAYPNLSQHVNCSAPPMPSYHDE